MLKTLFLLDINKVKSAVSCRVMASLLAAHHVATFATDVAEGKKFLQLLDTRDILETTEVSAYFGRR